MEFCVGAEGITLWVVVLKINGANPVFVAVEKFAIPRSGEMPMAFSPKLHKK